MYLYQPCLLSLFLYAWAFGPNEKGRWMRLLFPLLVLALSEVELTYTYVQLYPAALLLPLPFLLDRSRTVEWAEVLTGALLGGLLSWKVADLWPLGPTLPRMVVLLVPIVLLCRDRKDRALSCAVGGLLYELFFCLREYMLFSFCVIRLGSRDALTLSAASLCLLAVFEQARQALPLREKRSLSIGN